MNKYLGFLEKPYPAGGAWPHPTIHHGFWWDSASESIPDSGDMVIVGFQLVNHFGNFCIEG
ncbi:MAG: hypothetical protein ABW104_15870 [Candidatus Thiodiazotropha sp. 6PLUC2]